MRPRLLDIPIGYLTGETGLVVMVLLAIIAFAMFYLQRIEKKKSPEQKSRLFWVFNSLFYLSLLGLVVAAVARLLNQPVLHLNSYGLMLAIAFLLGVYLIVKKARKIAIPETPLLDISLYGIIISLFGARFFYMLLEYESVGFKPPFAFFNSPSDIFDLASGGLVVYGGFIFGIIFALIFIKIKKLPLGIVADIFAPTLALGVGFSRMGCNLAGCCYGAVADHNYFLSIPLSWFASESPVVKEYVIREGLALATTHIYPTQIISSFNGFIMFLLLEFIYYKYRERFKFDGTVFIIFMIYYAVSRFLIELLRNDTPQYAFNMTAAQITGIFVLVLAVGLIIYNRWRTRKEA